LPESSDVHRCLADTGGIALIMCPTRFQIARPDIVRYFYGLGRRVFKRRDLGQVLAKERASWRLATSMSLDKFVEELERRTKLRRVTLGLPQGQKVVRYLWGDASDFELVLSLQPRAYLSHYTALYLHELTGRVPKAIYVNSEQHAHPRGRPVLDQEDIDSAFAKPVRVTHNIATYHGRRICLLNGKYTGRLGVTEIQEASGQRFLSVTDIERTLIDCTVRPIYAGGVYEVLEAFRSAQGRISINRLAATLKKMEFLYPYHQAIGFYLERAGYPDGALRLLSKFEMRYDFYLTHEIKERGYSTRWRLYFPKAME